ncbi:Acyltransferase family, partial [Globisporangium polare]
VLIVIEMLLPSWLSSTFEWSLLRFWGKISFSVYLLHSFVIYSPFERKQAYYYDRLFSEFLLTLLLSTASYHLIEYPSQLLSMKISKALAAREALAGKPKLSPAEVMESGQSHKQDEGMMVVAAVAAPH